MMPINVAIIDDEPLARIRLKRLLLLIPEIKIVAESDSGINFFDALGSNQIDVLFLDIQMPEMDGFSVLKQFSPPTPKVIFVTAYDFHAVRAFEVNAFDYLVKPIALDRLKIAVKRLKHQIDVESRDVALHSDQHIVRMDVSNNLSGREIEVLRWAAIGKTSWEISAILKISESTVNFHLKNIAEKLGVKGRRAACSVAIAKGFISL